MFRQRVSVRQTMLPISPSPIPAQLKVDLAQLALSRERYHSASATDSHALSVGIIRVQRAQQLLDRRQQEYRDKFGREPR